jgi:hydrogenase maturation factor
MRIDESRFIWTEEIEGICQYFGIDPLQSIAEGTLILTAETSSASNILAALKQEGIEASVVGEVVPRKGGQEIKRRDGTVEKLKIPEQDPFWPIFFKDLEKQ